MAASYMGKARQRPTRPGAALLGQFAGERNWPSDAMASRATGAELDPQTGKASPSAASTACARARPCATAASTGNPASTGQAGKDIGIIPNGPGLTAWTVMACTPTC